MTEQDLKGKTAVVTGSAGGIGYEVACALLARGANVMLSDIKSNSEVLTGKKPEEIQAHFQAIDPTIALDIAGKSRSDVVKAIREQRPNLEIDHEFKTPAEIVAELHDQYKATGNHVGYMKADVADFAKMQALMEETAKLSDNNSIDMVVNNAGIQYKARIDEFPIEKWDAVIKTNLYGVFYGIQAATPYLKRSADGGRIFNIASVNGHVGSPEKAAYCSAKAAVENLTRVAHVDLAEPFGIASYTISPGFLDTPLARKQVQDFMVQGMDEEAATAKLLEFQRIKEFVPVSHISNIICNLSALPKGKALELSGRDLLIDNGWRDNVYEQRPPQMPADAITTLTKPALHANELREQVARAEVGSATRMVS